MPEFKYIRIPVRVTDRARRAAAVTFIYQRLLDMAHTAHPRPLLTFSVLEKYYDHGALNDTFLRVGAKSKNKTIVFDAHALGWLDELYNLHNPPTVMINRPGVYFVQGESVPRIKIGWSADPEERLGQLQVGCPVKLSILAILPGDRGDESEMHKKFHGDRLDGEWFMASDGLLGFIEDLKIRIPQTHQICVAGLKIKLIDEMSWKDGTEP